MAKGAKKKNEALKLKDGVLEGKKITQKNIEILSKLPSREILLAQTLATMNAPARNFVCVLAAVPRKLLYALNAIKEKKENN